MYQFKKTHCNHQSRLPQIVETLPCDLACISPSPFCSACVSSDFCAAGAKMT